MTVEAALRELIRDVVREELRREREAANVVDGYVATSEAARIAGVTAHTVRKWIRDGRLRSHGEGRHRIARGDLDAFLRRVERTGGLTPEALALRDFG